MLTVGSLFSGIGGFDLGLERTGMRVKWQVEIDDYCRRVLAKHWPAVTRYGDITTMDWATVQPVDLLCGGFPCQDLSFAGKRAGIDGARSSLWSEYVRAIRYIRPRYVLVENVPGLLTNAYMGRVLGDLAESGYDAEWCVLSACQFGAPHPRERVLIVAYPECSRGIRRSLWDHGSTHYEQRIQGIRTHWTTACEGCVEVANGTSYQRELHRNTYGLSTKVDCIRSLGNAIVPQIAEALGKMILEAHGSAT